ncbi:MAG: hydroxyphenylacetyl-CoA thioesterase PaaI [Granulosicoccus sp.]
MTPKQRAEQSAQAMWKDDNASVWFGIELVTVDMDFAVMRLIVQSHHVNGLGICHGGITFALADSAFAFACNSRNHRAVAQHNNISYLAPASTGDTLTATATQISLTGRSGITDVVVKNQNDVIIALFRGASRMINGQLFEEITSK